MPERRQYKTIIQQAVYKMFSESDFFFNRGKSTEDVFRNENKNRVTNTVTSSQKHVISTAES